MVQHKAMTALLERNDLVQVEGFIQKIKMIKVEAAKKKKWCWKGHGSIWWKDTMTLDNRSYKGE